MKKYFVIAICCVLGFLACTEERPGYYKGEDNWVQFYYVYTFNKTYIAPAYLPYEGYQAYVHSGKLRDTVYYRLHLIGQVSDKPRKVAFEPYETEMKYDYYTPAVEGENYVAFDDPDKVDFIDAYGLGKWGEAHGVKYNNYSNKVEVFEWITDTYAKAFKRVPLVINYHRLVGDTISWAEPHPDSKRLLERAIAKGYTIRHDAFGMTGYYEQWEKDFARAYRFRLPIIMEGGWITGAHHRYWIDPSGKYRQGHSEDVRWGEYEESRNAHVNMMDLRIGDEVASWFNSSFDLVKRFEREGGYRLYPTEVSFVNKARSGERVSVQHNWRNLGWGYCPTNIPQWKGKYKVCIALMDANHNIVKKQLADEADLSTWVQGRDGHYTTTVNLDGLQKGNYTWLIGLVDTTKACQPGLKMAVDKNLLFEGWCKVGKLKINK